ncbi:MAG: hypothetical protein U0V73_11890 [Acidimicrobiia bacterium]
MDESTVRTLKTIQAIASIGSALVTLRGITSKKWERRHTVLVAVSLTTSVALFVLPLTRAVREPAPPA